MCGHVSALIPNVYVLKCKILFDAVHMYICNHMIVSTIKDLQYEWYLKIVPILNCKDHKITCLLYTWQNYVCQPLPNANNSGHHVMIVTDRRTHVYDFIMTVHSWMCQDYVCLFVENH